MYTIIDEALLKKEALIKATNNNAKTYINFNFKCNANDHK